MGRAALGWSQSDLARRASLSVEIIDQFERQARALSGQSSMRIKRAFNGAGLISIPANRAGEGVRFCRPNAPDSLHHPSPVSSSGRRDFDDDLDAKEGFDDDE